ncbi:hypothetical protein DCAR_0209592 [Daucus carota subsp. sativus]|uniref:C2H2-type domain-containing protein n=1 Tax=Daucus carota subsp. sativus TaxID=79200 RepID=A0A166FDN8_DAUCS|nr:PREDICTED: zinc finger protein ZAT1-like [Daucus carota subsp. sativus]WOG90348.1 hypothetical protein DCAR_0209592 [Daucus carota subsp. sativus]
MGTTGDNKQPAAILHYCRICHRGFSCGGALGGHMRAHNIAEVINRIQEQQHQQQEGLVSGDKAEGNKHSYFLRTTSNRFSNLQSPVRGEYSCKRARLDDDRLLSPISSSVMEVEDGGARKGYIWKFVGVKGNEKGCFSREEEDLANVLVTLSNNSTDSSICKNKTKEACMAPLAKGLFQCKACKKVFNSHQALGGHRASHKKVKGCYAAKLDDLTDDEIQEDDYIGHDETPMSQEPPPDPPCNPTSQNTSHHDHDSTRAEKVHECSICHRVFSSGQALGGHKRFHWLQTDSTFITPFHDQFQFHYYGAENSQKSTTSCSKDSELLDLNLPPDQTVDEKSTPTYLSPGMNSIIKLNSDEENKGSENYNKIENCGRNNIGVNKLHESDHNYNGEEGRPCKLAKHCNVRDLKLEGMSSPWLQVGIASNK